MRYSIIIPVFNQWPYTEGCLKALAETIPLGESEVVIVDNGSTDETPSRLPTLTKELGINLQYHRFEGNRGFNVASNTGADLARGEFVVFLNNDTIPQPGWIEALNRLLVDPRYNAGIVGPKLLFPDTRTINHCGYAFNRKMGGFYPIYFDFAGDFPPVCMHRSCQALLGACLMLRRDTFVELGKFALYGLEDIDLCLKVRESGKLVRYVHTAEVLHYGGATFKNSDGSLIPPTTNEEFNKRWPAHTLTEDDGLFYSEDGFDFECSAEGQITLLPRTSAVNELKLEARNFYAQGNLVEAIKKMTEAFRLHARNIETIIQLALWVKQAGDSKTSEFLQQLRLELIG